jgi:hypothetical protein
MVVAHRSDCGAVRPSYQQGISRFLQRPRAALRYDAGLVAAPADRAKRRFLLRLFKERNHELFVESGTFLGGTVEYFLPHARRIISVEIEPDLYEAARGHFERSPSVELVLGDALEEIPRVLAAVSEPPFVYLDGHFTGGVNKEPGRFVEPAPGILEKLGELGLPAGTSIVVDDLRLFGRGDGFPPLDQLTSTARGAFPSAAMYVGIDCLVIAG